MSKILELAREAGIDDWWESGNEVRGELNDLLTKFYTLARADLEAENAKLNSCVKEWVAANGPLGWIEELRAENAKLREVLERCMAVMEEDGLSRGLAYKAARAALGETKC